jgi:hypothetical protein
VGGILKHFPSTLLEPLFSYLGCVGCHNVMDGDNTKAESFWFLSSKTSSHSVQYVAAAPTGSHFGRRLAL